MSKFKYEVEVEKRGGETRRRNEWVRGQSGKRSAFLVVGAYRPTLARKAFDTS